MVACLTISSLLLRLGYVNIEKSRRDDEYAEPKTAFGFVGGIVVMIISVIFLLSQGSDSLSKVCTQNTMPFKVLFTWLSNNVLTKNTMISNELLKKVLLNALGVTE